MGNEPVDEPLGVLAITHYSRLLGQLRPDRVYIVAAGRIVESGGPELAAQLEADGYAAFADPDADGADTDGSSAGTLDDLFSI